MAEFRAGGGLFQRSYIRSTAPSRAGHHRITCGGLRCRSGCINKPDRSETVKNGCEAFRMPYNDIRPYSYARRRAANRKVLPPPKKKKKIHDWEDVRSSVRFLTRTFRNVFYVRVGKRHVRLWRSQRSRTVVWGGERWDGSWTRPPHANRTPAATSAGVIFPETGQFLLLCSLQLWQQLPRCRQTRARVQVFF